MKVIYICTGDVSVYDSQVMELLDFLITEKVDVLLAQGYTTDLERKSIEYKMANHKAIKTIWFKWYPHYRIFKYNQIKSLSKAILSIPDYEHAVYHVRGDFSSYITKRVLNKIKVNSPMIVDMRAIVSEEMKYKLDKVSSFQKLQVILLERYFKYINKQLFINDNRNIIISSVSPLINRYIDTRYPSCSYPKFYNPNIAGLRFKYSKEGRLRIRQKFGFSDSDVVVVCSTNSNAIWQKDETIIRNLLSKGFKVLNLSRINPNIPGCVTTLAPFSEMPDYLSAADMAVLWRDNTFMNNSSSPSKFSEFASMGLYVIHNNSVEVAINYIKQTGAGCLINSIDDFNINPSNWDNSCRDQWILSGNKEFGVHEIGYSYITIYNQSLHNTKDYD